MVIKVFHNRTQQPLWALFIGVLLVYDEEISFYVTPYLGLFNQCRAFVELESFRHESLNFGKHFIDGDSGTTILINIVLSFQLLCATVFLFPAWYLTSQPLDVNRMGLAWLTCALVTILAQTFGFVVGASCGMKVTNNLPIRLYKAIYITQLRTKVVNEW